MRIILTAVLLLSFFGAVQSIPNCVTARQKWCRVEPENDDCGSFRGCPAGWSKRVFEEGGFLQCNRDGCIRTVCDACKSGFYKSSPSDCDNILHYTACAQCKSLSNCAVPVTCTTGNNAQCQRCNDGFFLEEGTTNNPEDSCEPCASISNCAVTVKCSTSQDQQCDECAEGYFLSGDKKQCEPCQTGCGKCTRRTVTLNAQDGCQKCAEDWFENRDRSACVSDCNSGEYRSRDGSGTPYCEPCEQFGGCSVAEDCDKETGANSFCPGGSCLETHWADVDKVCQPRLPAPVVETDGPIANLNPTRAGGTANFDWTAEIEQFNNPFTSKVDLKLKEDGSLLQLEWKDFNGQPTAERRFRLRLIRNDAQETLWTDFFSFSCECSGRSGYDGEAEFLTVIQDQSVVRFEIAFHSYCADSYAIHRNTESGFELNKYWDGNANTCNLPDDKTRNDDLSINNQISASLVKLDNDGVSVPIQYRIYAMNTAIGYESFTTIDHVVEFWCVLKGAVRSQNLAGAQLADVKITVTIKDPALSAPLVYHAETGPSQLSSTRIEYYIPIQSDLIKSLSVPVEITAQYPPNGEGNQHKFGCPLLGDKCIATNEALPLDERTYHVEMDLIHTQTTEVVFFDMSTYTIAGRVTVYDTSEYTSSKKACGLKGVKICPYEPDSMTRLNLICAETDVNGEYQMAVPAGQSLTLRPTYLNGTSDGFTVPFQSVRSVLSNQVDLDFEYKEQKALEVTVGGGACYRPIGTFELLLSIDSCPNYERVVPVQSSRIISFGPVDVTVRVNSFEAATNLNDNEINSASVPDYLAKSKQQTKYVNFFSRVDSDELVANFDASGNAKMEFMFRSPLQFRFATSPGPRTPPGTSCAGVDVAQQNSLGSLAVFVFEEYGNAGECNSVAGKVTVVDEVTDIDYECTSAQGCTLEIGEITDSLGTTFSGFELDVLPGAPNLFPPHHRKFYFYWDDPGRNGDPSEPYAVHPILVTGQRKMGDSFSVTLSEGNPRTILYDPPGGTSFSELLDGVSLSTGLSVSTNTGFGVDTALESILGVDEEVETCVGVGASVCKKLVDYSNSVGVAFEESFVDGNEEVSDFSFELAVENTVSTSAETDIPGFYSDVVIASAFTVTYERTRKLEVLPGECDVANPSAGINIFDNAVYRPALEGFVVKTFYDIEFVELPKIEDNIGIILNKLDRDEYSDSQDGADEQMLDKITLQRLNATKANWKRLMIAHEERAKGQFLVSPSNFFRDVECRSAIDECRKLEGENCAPGELIELPCSSITDTTDFNFGNDNSRIFFGGGGTAYGFSAQTSSENVETYTATYDLEILAGLKFTNDLTLGSFQLATEASALMRTEIRKSSETTKGTAKSKTVAFTLSDPDIGDSFDVEIWYDSEYGTPYFKTIAGASMCPGELGTVHRMEVGIELQGLKTIKDIPQNTPYILPVDLINLSPTDDVGDYVLFYDAASNPNGLRLSVDGSGLSERLFREIPVGEKLRINIEVDPVPGVFDYENITLLAVAECELGVDMFRDNIGAELVVSLHWQQECSQVEFSGVLNDFNTFSVILDPDQTTYTMDVLAYNPENYVTSWQDHSYLKEVYVRYRRVGDSLWKRARKVNGEFASFEGTDSQGFASIEIDVTSWIDGEYELNLFADCGSRPGALGSSQSRIISGRIDRVAPRLFSQFIDPADGFWSPGDRIAVRMTEEIDCRTPYTFNTNIIIEEPYPDNVSAQPPVVVNMNNLDLKCSGDTVEVAFSMQALQYTVDDLQGKQFTVLLENVRDVAGNFQAGTISQTFTWKFVCPQVSFEGQIARFDTFTVNKNTSPTIDVGAYNPNFDKFLARWQDHPYLEDVYVRYRRAGDNVWLQATKPDGSLASFGTTTDAEGFAEVLQVDVSGWDDGDYELTLFADCGDRPGAMGAYESAIISGKVDRVAPRLFSQYAEPADGFWGPGKTISARLTENIDCRPPYTFDARVEISERYPGGDPSEPPVVVGHDDLDLKCSGDTVEVAFSLQALQYTVDDLQGKELTVKIEGIQDYSGNSQEEPISWSFLWKYYCSQVEFDGQIARFDTFTVNKNTSPTIDVGAYNPDNDYAPWQTHPYLEDVYVRYRRAGDNVWLQATKPDGSLASFGTTTDAEGFAEVLQVDVSGWDDGDYELTLFADCGDRPGSMGAYESAIISGKVDRVAPRLFSQYAEPADGFWGPGKTISARLTENIDCRPPYTFDARVEISERYPGGDPSEPPVVVGHDDLDLKCSGDTVEVAFSLQALQYTVDDLQGKEFTVLLENVQDETGNVQEEPISWSFLWKYYCSQVEFDGQIARFDTFTVNKNTSPTIDVGAYNPDNDYAPWQTHPYLEDVYVRYRRAGDNVWLQATKPDGSLASFGTTTDAEGFAEVLQVDVSGWDDGDYELTLFADCGDRPGAMGAYESAIISGKVDRVAPRLFSQYAEPADGFWGPGDPISARLTENIDCRPPYTFDARVEISERYPGGDPSEPPVVVGHDDLDLKCSGDTVEVAFSLQALQYTVDDLQGKEFTVLLENVQDETGNVQEEPISWSFLWKYYCSQVEFDGQIARFDTFTVNKNTSPTIDVGAYNPDNDYAPWQTHPYLEDVYVRYRRAGDNVWLQATKPDGSLASFGTTTDAEGFAEVLQVDVSGWDDGDYELTLFADCGDRPGSMGAYESAIISGKVDRVAPRLFSQYAEPADGFWGPGKTISARLTENIDCRPPYTFDARVEISERYPGGDPSEPPVVVGHDDLDLKCSGDTVEVAFSLQALQYTVDDLQGKEFTVLLENVQDETGNVQEEPISWSFLWKYYCSQVEFDGQIARFDTFTVNKNTSPTIDVGAYNPDNDYAPWQTHPYLEDVYVRYRRAGDNVWLQATKPDGSLASFGTTTDAEGFAEVLQVDVSGWDDGDYELTLFADCGDRPGSMGAYESAIISGKVDRVAPRLFSQYAEPADGWWSPGDPISARLTENIDCRPPYTFRAYMVFNEDSNRKRPPVVVNNDHLDLKCVSDTIEIAFKPYSILYTLESLRGKEISVYLENIHDIVGNIQDGSLQWTFTIQSTLDVGNAALLLSLYFTDLKILRRDLGITDLEPSELQVKKEQIVDEVCELGKCDPKGTSAPTVTDIHPGETQPDTVLVVLKFSENTGGIQVAENLYKRLGNETAQSTVPDNMLLSSAEMTALQLLPSADPEEQIQGSEQSHNTMPTEIHQGWMNGIMGGLMVTAGLLVMGVLMFVYVRRSLKRMSTINQQSNLDPKCVTVNLPDGKVEFQADLICQTPTSPFPLAVSRSTAPYNFEASGTPGGRRRSSYILSRA